MGLSLASVSLSNGITLNNVYIRLNSIAGDKNNLQYNMNYYVSRDDDKAGKSYVQQSPIYQFTPSTDPDSARWDKQAYDHAKTQTAFTGASDVLEN